MRVLAIHSGHDACCALFDDYELLFTAKEERLDRIKMSGYKYPNLCLGQLKKSFDLKSVDALVMTKWNLLRQHTTTEPLGKKIERMVGQKLLGKEDKYTFLISEMIKTKKDVYEVVDKKSLLKYFGLRDDCKLYFSSHHKSHALPALFYKPEWKNALIYTADGGGDTLHYSAFYFDGEKLVDIFDSERIIHYNCGEKIDKMGVELGSVGLMYSNVTRICGFSYGKHEGKITGLAAFGKPVVADKIISRYKVEDSGHIVADYKSSNEIEEYLKELSRGISKEDFACSAQKALEEIVLASINKISQKYRFSNVGLSGGVFANVRLNQKISELPYVEDVFVFPPMSDEGLVFGSAFDFLIQENGFKKFTSSRAEFGMPYFGEKFNDFTESLNSKFEIVCREGIAKKCAELLNEGAVCALLTDGMEYGPRALGARSMLINPKDKAINDKVNKRLNRTEFMPFAPYVRDVLADKVFCITRSNRNAMKYMTITCDVKEEWRDKIPAVVHVDGTARPQTIKREDNPLYYDILFEFEKISGLPCLVNTSFNAHEEPIINSPQEALAALRDDRMDYLITDWAIIKRKIK